MTPQLANTEPAEVAETGSLGQEPANNEGAGTANVDLNQHWEFIVRWLLALFRWLTRQDAEDLVQIVMIYIWKKSVPVTEANAIPILKRVARREAINLWRKKRAKIRGGDEPHVSLDELGDIECGKRRTSAIIEGLEAVDSVLGDFAETLSKREKICFGIRLQWLPFEPELERVYEELSEEERVLFLPASRKEVDEPERKILIKAQFTRSMSAVKKRIADYLDAEDDGDD